VAALDEHLEFSGVDLRTTLGAFATGVTVITTVGKDHAYGMTANAFSSVSLDPPLVLTCVISGTSGSEMICRNGVFAVNILREDQEALSRYFAWRDRPRAGDAFRDVAHRPARVTGCPLVDNIAAYLDCRVHTTHEAGDHIIVIGEVLAIGIDRSSRPLIFHHGAYRFLEADVAVDPS
jgi:flavin reductase